jgi:hypothetical protein
MEAVLMVLIVVVLGVIYALWEQNRRVNEWRAKQSPEQLLKMDGRARDRRSKIDMQVHRWEKNRKRVARAVHKKK